MNCPLLTDTFTVQFGRKILNLVRPLSDGDWYSRGFQLNVSLPEWRYICIYLDTVARQLDLYVGDRKMEAHTSNYSIRWEFLPNLQLTSLHIFNEVVGPINLFAGPFQPGTCGQNGTLVAWPAMLAAMQPMGRRSEKLDIICGQNRSQMVYVSSKTSYAIAMENCKKIGAGGRFPTFSSFEAHLPRFRQEPDRSKVMPSTLC
jgi:hypothetical protein